MTLQQLSYLIKVAECGNITEAAEQLYISQPSLSTAISNLEKEMGVTAFIRTKKGVIVTHEGEELLSFARMLLEQADIMKEHFGVVNKREAKFSVSCQHYSFAVNAFVDVVNQFDADKYSFILRETQTGEIIDDVAYGKSELGILYLSDNNEEVISKLLTNRAIMGADFFREVQPWTRRDYRRRYSRCSTGFGRTHAHCHGAPTASRTTCGSRRSCCSRRASRPCAGTTRAFSRPRRMCSRSRLDAVAHSCDNLFALKFLFRYGIGQDIYKGGITIEFNYTFGNCKSFLRPLKNNFCIR